uniref:Uncharacterized protein n=1 Tax=Nelumbo nucifera TaxID=4432 RepID=A0A822XPL8_NELNU|nr:TPA_asm: hypothetical protein HUJ06_020891 [Nelumbo nucifera]
MVVGWGAPYGGGRGEVAVTAVAVHGGMGVDHRHSHSRARAQSRGGRGRAGGGFFVVRAVSRKSVARACGIDAVVDGGAPEGMRGGFVICSADGVVVEGAAGALRGEGCGALSGISVAGGVYEEGEGGRR